MSHLSDVYKNYKVYAGSVDILLHTLCIYILTMDAEVMPHVGNNNSATRLALTPYLIFQFASC